MNRFVPRTLLAAILVAALAVGVWSGSGSTEAQSYCQRLVTRVIDGHWATVSIPCDGLSAWDLFNQDTTVPGLFREWLVDAHGNRIAGDAPEPGVVEHMVGDDVVHRGVYVGDRVPTPVADANGVIRIVNSEIAISYQHDLSTGESHISTPQRPAISPDDEVVYTLGGNHRAVRGADGHCYRDQRISGRWQRSGSYGTDDEACRQATWNAYLRSQDSGAIDPGADTFPSGSPPVVGVSQTLVSNTGQAPGPTGAFHNDHAQAFTTGIHEAGYRVTKIGVNLQVGATPRTEWDVQLWSAHATSGQPGEVLSTLIKPSSISTGVVMFTVPRGGIDLDAETTYWVVVNNHASNSGWFTVNTNSDADDPDPSSGWSIANSSRYRNHGSAGGWSWFGASRMISITGVPK